LKNPIRLISKKMTPETLNLEPTSSAHEQEKRVIAIIDYRAGNLTSVARALDHLGQPSVITQNPDVLLGADRIIFPGVGAAGEAMANLRQLQLDQVIGELHRRAVPFLGICLGTQIILERSEEDAATCLGIIPGVTRAFPQPLQDDQGQRLKIPHMGWNQVRLDDNPHALAAGMDPLSEFYFVHSYYPDPAEPQVVCGYTEYGITFPSFLARGNLAAVQFHPEKSGRPGLKFLENFCRWHP
jgi:glutamine amidotransferase